MSASNNASEKRERPNGRGDRLMRSSVYTKSLPGHRLPGAINRDFFGLVAATIYRGCRRIAEAMGMVRGSRLWQARRLALLL
jgi:hypothetical protein